MRSPANVADEEPEVGFQTALVFGRLCFSLQSNSETILNAFKILEDIRGFPTYSMDGRYTLHYRSQAS